MKRSFFSVVVLLIFVPALNAAIIGSENNLNFPKITSYRSASCGCCKKWVNHLRSNGLEVVDNVVEDISLIKKVFVLMCWSTELTLKPLGSSPDKKDKSLVHLYR